MSYLSNSLTSSTSSSEVAFTSIGCSLCISETYLYSKIGCSIILDSEETRPRRSKSTIVRFLLLTSNLVESSSFSSFSPGFIAKFRAISISRFVSFIYRNLICSSRWSKYAAYLSLSMSLVSSIWPKQFMPLFPLMTAVESCMRSSLRSIGVSISRMAVLKNLMLRTKCSMSSSRLSRTLASLKSFSLTLLEL